MNRPSGDQTGLEDIESTNRTGLPPSTGTLNTRLPRPSLAAMAIHRPSGDHDGAPRTSSDSASVRTPLPLALVHCSVDRPWRRTARQMLRRSGETAAAPATAPSSGFHTSLAPAAVRRHRPSVPPRDARYSSDESGAKRGAADRAVGRSRRAALASPETSRASGTVQSCTLGFDTV